MTLFKKIKPAAPTSRTNWNCVKYSWLVVLVVYTLPVRAQEYVIDATRSATTFSIRNLGITVDGKFTGLQGNIIFDSANMHASVFIASINAETISTGINLRDKHLRKKEFLDTKSNPIIKFVSIRIIQKGDRSTITGKLMMKNITKEISFPFKFNMKQDVVTFTGKFSINRRDFGVGGSSISMSDTVNISVRIAAVKKVTMP